MIAVAVHIIVALIILGLLFWLISFIPLPAPVPQIIRVVFIVLCILVVLSMVPGLGWGGLHAW